MTSYLQTNWDYNSEQLVEVYDELPLWAAPFGLKLLDGIRYKKGLTVLDIGFGAGFPLTEIAMRLGMKSKIYGIDPWDAAVNRALKKIAFFGIKNIEIIRGKAENLPLGDNSIDLIVSNNGINNVSDPDLVLAECSRVMKPGGQFIHTMNLRDTMLEFYTVLSEVLKEMNLHDCLDRMHKQIEKKRKALEPYLEKLTANGFLVESVKHDSFQYQFTDGTSLLNHHFIRLSFLDGWKEIVPSAKQPEVFERTENELNRQSEETGLVKLSVPFVVIDCKKK